MLERQSQDWQCSGYLSTVQHTGVTSEIAEAEEANRLAGSDLDDLGEGKTQDWALSTTHPPVVCCRVSSVLLDLGFAGGIECGLLQIVLQAANDLGMTVLHILAESLHARKCVTLI